MISSRSKKLNEKLLINQPSAKPTRKMSAVLGLGGPLGVISVFILNSMLPENLPAHVADAAQAIVVILCGFFSGYIIKEKI